jgi:hypothetical protein
MLDLMETKNKSFCDSSNTIKKIKMKTQNKRQHLQVIHVTGEMCIQFIRVPTIWNKKFIKLWEFKNHIIQ